MKVSCVFCSQVTVYGLHSQLTPLLPVAIAGTKYTTESVI